jgi:uncharacterized protein YjbI with pentapeptide repeats
MTSQELLSLLKAGRRPEQNMVMTLDLLGMDLSGFDLSEIKFVDCQLDKVNFSNAILDQVAFIDCSLLSSNFSAARLHGTMFTNQRLEVDLTATDPLADAPPVPMQNCQFTDANLQEVMFSICDLQGSDFNTASLQQVVF